MDTTTGFHRLGALTGDDSLAPRVVARPADTTPRDGAQAGVHGLGRLA